MMFLEINFMGIKLCNKSLWICQLCLFLSILLSGCGGESGESPAPVTDDWQTNAITILASIDLPKSSPISSDQLSVEVFDKVFVADESGSINIKSPADSATDSYIMLPPKEGQELPTIYLFNTILPGEGIVELSAKSTAIALIMAGIPQYYLLNAGSAIEVKDLIRQHANAFITKFEDMIENDPYVLSEGNMPNVLDDVYISSAVAVADTLRDLLEQKRLSSLSNTFENSAPSNKTLFNVNTMQVAKAFSPLSAGGDSAQFFVTPEVEQQGFSILPEIKDDKMTGNIIVQNDTRLYANVRVTDTVGNEIQEIPNGFVNSAFNPKMLSSQAGFWGGFTSSEQMVSVDYRNVTVDVETGGLLDPQNDYFNTSAPSLMARTAYSNFILPVIKIVVPIGDAGKIILGVFYDLGAFDGAVMDAWQSGDPSQAISHMIANINSKAGVSKLVEVLISQGLDPKDKIKFLAKIGLKLTVAEVMGAIVAADLYLLQYDLENTNPVLTFYVTFPISIDYISPEVVDKKATELQQISIIGNGFAVFEHKGTQYGPKVTLTALDSKGVPLPNIGSFIYDGLQGELDINQKGTSIKFDFPLAWLGGEQSFIDTISKVNIKLSHQYFEPGYWGDTYQYVELPAEGEPQDRFQLELLNELVITSLSKTSVQSGDELIIYGSDFADDADLNNVYIIFDSGTYNNPVQVSYRDINGSYIKVIIPEHSELNLLGKAAIFVELEDETQSNKLAVNIVPSNVMADPESSTFSSENLTVTLSAQEQQSFVLYKIGAGVEQVYQEPILLDKTSTIFTRASTVSGGETYYSNEISFTYSQQVTEITRCPLTFEPSLGDEVDELGYTMKINAIDKNNDGADDDYGYCKYRVTPSPHSLYSETYFKDGLLHGPVNTYNIDGSPHEIKAYIMGEPAGVWLLYSNGYLFNEMPYSNGLANGTGIRYYADSTQPKWEIQYVDGKRNGTYKYFNSDGTLSSCQVYKDSLYVSDCAE